MMMTIKARVFLMVLCSAWLLVGCDRGAHKTPDFLMYQGQVIDPYCMGSYFASEASFAKEPIILADCTHKGRTEYKNTFKQDKDYLIQEMETLDQSEWTGHMYFKYRYVAGDENRFIIEAYASTGGSGFFSAIYIMRRQGDALYQLDQMAGGDRCGGGLEHRVRYIDHKIHYTQSLTAAEFYHVAQIPDAQQLKNLEYCAICCKGTVQYEDKNLVSYTLDPALLDDTRENASKEQICFEKQLKTLVKDGLTIVPQETMRDVLLKASEICKS
jgi:hypothetical protein